MSAQQKCCQQADSIGVTNYAHQGYHFGSVYAASSAFSGILAKLHKVLASVVMWLTVCASGRHLLLRQGLKVRTHSPDAITVAFVTCTPDMPVQQHLTAADVPLTCPQVHLCQRYQFLVSPMTNPASSSARLPYSAGEEVLEHRQLPSGQQQQPPLNSTTSSS